LYYVTTAHMGRMDTYLRLITLITLINISSELTYCLSYCFWPADCFKHIYDQMTLKFMGNEYEIRQSLLSALQQSFESNGKKMTAFDIEVPHSIRSSRLEEEKTYWLSHKASLQSLVTTHILISNLKVHTNVQNNPYQTVPICSYIFYHSCFQYFRLIAYIAWFTLLLQVKQHKRRANKCQQALFNRACDLIDNVNLNNENIVEDIPILHVDGRAGTGKTTVINSLMAHTRLRGRVCLPAASTALAAQLYERGQTVHALGSINVTKRIGEIITSSMGKKSMAADLIRGASLIVIDEISSLNRGVLEAFYHMLRQLNYPGVLLLAGDFRQIPPVVRGSSRSMTIDASPRSSNLWSAVESYELFDLMRTRTDIGYGAFLTDLADDNLPAIAGESTDIPGGKVIDLSIVPKHQIFDRSNLDLSVKFVFGHDLKNYTNRCILATRVDTVNSWNAYIQRKLTGESKTYFSSTTIQSDDNPLLAAELNDTDFLDNLYESGVPPHKLVLRVGDVAYITRTIDKQKQLVTNARVKIVSVGNRQIGVQLMNNPNQTVLAIPRIPFVFTVGQSDLKVLRIQFPLQLAYAMTFNKAQGQTLERVLVDLREPAFSHGHLNVAMSRVRTRSNIALYMDDRDTAPMTVSVVYPELLERVAQNPRKQVTQVASHNNHWDILNQHASMTDFACPDNYIFEEFGNQCEVDSTYLSHFDCPNEFAFLESEGCKDEAFDALDYLTMSHNQILDDSATVTCDTQFEDSSAPPC